MDIIWLSVFPFIIWYWCSYHHAFWTVVALSNVFFVPFGQTLEKGSFSVSQTKHCPTSSRSCIRRERGTEKMKLREPWSLNNSTVTHSAAVTSQFQRFKVSQRSLESMTESELHPGLRSVCQYVSYSSKCEWTPAIIYNTMFNCLCGDEIRSFL